MKRIPAILALLVATLLVAHARADEPAGPPAAPSLTTTATVSSQAPPATAQLAPLVGTWRCTIRNKNQDGTFSEPREASWRFFYILDGWALMDEWRSKRPDGSPFVGVNIRHYNPESKQWVAKWLAQGLADWRTFSAKFSEGRFVMQGESVSPNGSPGLARVTFYDIGPKSFRWKTDWSTDGGQTWLPEVARIEATRVE